MTTKFKVGDKVKILSKSTGSSWGSCRDSYPNNIGYVTGYEDDNIVTVWKFMDKDNGNFFLEKDLELIKEIKFKIGDKVKILSKSTGRSWESCRDLYFNNIGYVNGYEDDNIVLVWNVIEKNNGNFFLEKDLELIKKGEKKMENPKYEIINTLFTTEIIKAQGSVSCSKFNARLIEFIKFFGAIGAVSAEHKEKFFNEFATQEDLNWLEQKGFIRKKKEEVFYKAGDVFRRDNVYNEEYFMIVYFYEGNNCFKAFLCQISSGDSNRGNRNVEPIKINDSDKITQKEFEKMSGSSTFTLVKNATINVVS